MFQLVEFRKLNTSIENVDVPARPENRIVTDRKGFAIFGVAILILVREFQELSSRNNWMTLTLKRDYK